MRFACFWVKLLPRDELGRGERLMTVPEVDTLHLAVDLVGDLATSARPGVRGRDDALACWTF
jgi:hypothetical protein